MAMHSPRLPLSIDPLIEEAKQRMRRRRLILAGVLAGAVALVLALTFASPSPSPHVGPPVAIHIPSGGRVPLGVRAIDVQAPLIPALHVTDPSQINHIVAWFDALDTQRHALRTGIYSGVCAGGFAANVRFVFRAESGRELAKGYSPPVLASACSPTYFIVRGRPRGVLVDENKASPLIDDVQRLLGVTIKERLFRG
jgi:hypothetical protein